MEKCAAMQELEESDPESDIESDKKESPNKVMDNQPIYQALKEKQDPQVSKRILIFCLDQNSAGLRLKTCYFVL